MPSVVSSLASTRLTVCKRVNLRLIRMKMTLSWSIFFDTSRFGVFRQRIPNFEQHNSFLVIQVELVVLDPVGL